MTADPGESRLPDKERSAHERVTWWAMRVSENAWDLDWAKGYCVVRKRDLSGLEKAMSKTLRFVELVEDRGAHGQ